MRYDTHFPVDAQIAIVTVSSPSRSLAIPKHHSRSVEMTDEVLRVAGRWSARQTFTQSGLVRPSCVRLSAQQCIILSNVIHSCGIELWKGAHIYLYRVIRDYVLIILFSKFHNLAQAESGRQWNNQTEVNKNLSLTTMVTLYRNCDCDVI